MANPKTLALRISESANQTQREAWHEVMARAAILTTPGMVIALQEDMLRIAAGATKTPTGNGMLLSSFLRHLAASYGIIIRRYKLTNTYGATKNDRSSKAYDDFEKKLDTLIRCEDLEFKTDAYGMPVVNDETQEIEDAKKTKVMRRYTNNPLFGAF